MCRILLTTILVVSLLVMSQMSQANDIYSMRKRDSIKLDSPIQKGERGRWWQEKSDHTTRFQPYQLIVPVTLFSIGALGIGQNAPFDGLNQSIRERVGSYRVKQLHFDDYVQYAPVALYLGLCALPVKAKHTFVERVCIASVTYLSMTALVNGLKYTIREPRPNGTRNSFPSGHTATVFAGAELVRAEYGWGYGIPAYLVACGVGFMRIYNDRHWFTDVLAGAAVGIVSAQIGQWMLPLCRKIFRLKSSTAVAMAPIYYPEQRAIGGSCAICF